MQVNLELKPCPFCGAEVAIRPTTASAEYYRFYVKHPDYLNRGRKNRCIFDDGKTFYADDIEDAVNVWNRRAENG